jgi:hypothetical protein
MDVPRREIGRFPIASIDCASVWDPNVLQVLGFDTSDRFDFFSRLSLRASGAASAMPVVHKPLYKSSVNRVLAPSRSDEIFS